MEKDNAEPATSAVVGTVLLAAGNSSRLGRPKQLLPLGNNGQTLLRHAAEAAVASESSATIVVLGEEDENGARMERELNGLPVQIVRNAMWREGMASSLRTGIHALRSWRKDVDAVVVLLCDQPHLTTDTLNALVGAHRTTQKPIVASQYEGGPGAPCLFYRSLFAELCSLSGGEGAKRVILQHGDAVALVPFPEGALDIDTPADVERVVRVIQ